MRTPHRALLGGLAIFLSAATLGRAPVCGPTQSCAVDTPRETVDVLALYSVSTQPFSTPAEIPETARYRDDIMSGGRLLAYDLQEIMQDCCEAYGVPYALALAIAEVETRFDPDAVSPTHDFGLMQINQVNHAWLLEKGFDVGTYDGNIGAGLYIIGGYLDAYGDIEMALMAYNNGPAGARRLWDAGTYQTGYTRKVMAAFEHWTSILED